jgi:hypothetical protein
MTQTSDTQTIRHTPGDIMSAIARINAGMPAVNGNGQPTNEPTQHTVINLVTTPAQLLMQAIHDETAKLNAQPADETDTTHDAEQDTPTP